MLKEAEQLQLEGEKLQLQQYLQHPISQRIKRDHEEQETGLLSVILEIPVHDVESLVKHFEAIGHLRGLRRSRAISTDALEEIEEKLKEIES